MNLRTYKDPLERRVGLATELQIELNQIGESLMDPTDKIHCENLIGAVTIPLGVAGPLHLRGPHAEGEFYVPLATTEGALVASISRGCKAIESVGGADVYAYKYGQTRGPVFAVKSVKQARTFYTWIRDNEKRLAEVAESTSHHLKYKSATIKGVGNYVYVRFHFETGDAMGMNMVTIATQKIVELIEQETEIKCLAVAGNYDLDKKPSWLNFIATRGYEVWAEVTLTAEIIKTILKTTPQKIFDVWLAKCMVGSAMAGSLGFNSHVANVVAAFYAATGQDLGHIAEGSMGITTTKLVENNLYCSIYLPSIQLGTVGGGTTLGTQSEARSLLKVEGAQGLAEVLAGAVLAGEISLLASLAEGTLARAHKNLGR